MPVSRNYGSIEPSIKDDFISRSVDVSRLGDDENNNRFQNNKSGTKRQKRYYDYRHDQRDEYSQTSADILLSTRPNGALFNNKYIVEPVAFIQNLASSIMGMFYVQLKLKKINLNLKN